jgi:hypothetical protein
LGNKSFPALSQPATQEIVLHPPRIGVVTFQNNSDPTSGAACVAPKSTTYFNRRSELASDVLWISEATEGVNAQNFRPPQYLRSSPKQIADDLGVSLSDAVEGLPKVAETVGRVRDIAAHAYPWTDFSTDWSYPTLAAAIAKILPPTGEIITSMESPLRQAYQSYSSVPDQRFPEGTAQTIYTLRSNRLRYAQYICSTMVPSSAWISVPDVSRHSFKIDEFLNPDSPSLVEASIEFHGGLNDAVTPALVAFGSVKQMGRTPLRKWVCQQELAWLVRHATVHITSAFMSQGSEPLSARHALPTSLTADPVYALSVAAGLVAESHWVGLSNVHPVRRAGNSATGRYVDVASPTAVWLRAADRAYGFAMAKIVAERGFIVKGYGYGSVSFFGPKNDIGSIIELADELGTCHPCLAAMEQRMMIGNDVNVLEG